MKINRQQYGIIIILFIAFAALSRLVPHPPNFTAVGAIALFGGAYFSSRWLAWLVPVIAVWFSDLLLNNLVYAAYYDGFVFVSTNFLFTSAALILMVLLARFVLHKISAGRVIGASLSASLIFFLISNFGAWAGSVYYTKDLTGLIAAYTAGLPFFLNTLAGDLFFCAVMFGAMEWVRRKHLQTVISS